jgi:hypothetical protein
MMQHVYLEGLLDSAVAPLSAAARLAPLVSMAPRDMLARSGNFGGHRAVPNPPLPDSTVCPFSSGCGLGLSLQRQARSHNF